MIATVKLSKLLEAKSGINKQGTPYTIQEMIFTVCKKDGSETYDKLLVLCRDTMYINNPVFREGITGILTYYSYVDEFVRQDDKQGFQQRNVFKGWQTTNAAMTIAGNIAQAAEQKRLEAIANKPEQEDDEDDTPF